MSVAWGKRLRSESGQAIAEAAILLPVFALVAFMVVDIQWMTKDAANLDYIVTEAARCEAIQSPACSGGTNTVQNFAATIAANLRLDNGIQLQTPPCTETTCTVTATYNYKAFGAWFPRITIVRTGVAAVAPQAGGQ